VGFALVLKHFQFERGLRWVVKVGLNELRINDRQALFKAQSCFFQNSHFLVAERHIVHD
jgi:hypothetical protein